MDKRKNITLIGMPGAGKSTIGVLLAKETGSAFIDTDLLLQQKHHKLLQAVVDELGFQGFIEEEGRTICTVSPEHAVIATGGSAIYYEPAMKHLSEISEVIYLRLSLDEIDSRINNRATRGIALKEGQTLASLYEERVPLYEKYAHRTVDCDGRNPEQVLQAILQK